MTTYIVKGIKSGLYYVYQTMGNFPADGDIKVICLEDKYSYTIPSEELIVVLMANDGGVF